MTREQTFPAAPHAVSAARRFVTDAVGEIDADLRDALELMVSELASNAIGHGQTSFEVTVTHTAGEIRVEVRDHGSGTPIMRTPGPADLRGRGLRIVDGLSDHWGVRPQPPAGKVVWFTLAVPADVGATSSPAHAAEPLTDGPARSDQPLPTPPPGPACQRPAGPPAPPSPLERAGVSVRRSGPRRSARHRRPTRVTDGSEDRPARPDRGGPCRPAPGSAGDGRRSRHASMGR